MTGITVPNTVEGAIVLSIIDFALSMVFIAGIGVMLHFFPHLNRIGEVKEEDLHE
jgi:hypothetical protein